MERTQRSLACASWIRLRKPDAVNGLDLQRAATEARGRGHTVRPLAAESGPGLGRVWLVD